MWTVSFLYATSITLAVACGLLFGMLFGAIISRKFRKKRIYKIITGLLVAAVLVLSAFVVFFTSDTVITELSTIITPAGPTASTNPNTTKDASAPSSPFGKTKPYYLMGLFAGCVGILSAGSIWSVGYL